MEYNADTPTSLLEAAVIQWHWLQEVNPAADQFNSIWEGLTRKWMALKEEGYFPSGRIHFACVDSPEDYMTIAVLMDTATEAGIDVTPLLEATTSAGISAKTDSSTRRSSRLRRFSSSIPGSGSSPMRLAPS